MLKLLIKTRILALIDAFNQGRNGGKKKKNRSLSSIVLIFTLLGIIILGSVGFTLYGFCNMFVSFGHPWAFWVLAIIYASLLCIIGSFFAVKSQIFESKDNEMLLAMPIPPRYIFISRMVVLLVMNFIFASVVLLPAVVVYLMLGSLSVGGVIGYIVVLLTLPLLSLTVSTVVAWIVSEIASRVKHKNLVTMILFLAFFGGYFYFSFYIGSLVGQDGAIFNPTGLQNTFLFWWGGDAIANANLLSLLWFVLCAVIPALITVWVLDKSFIRIAIAKKSATKIEYKGNTTKSSGTYFALLKKEFWRFFGSVPYMLNAGIGCILSLVVAIIFAFSANDWLPITTAVGYEWLADLIPMAIVIICAFLGSMSYVSAPSISLEDKQLWILQTMPVDAKTVLMEKLSTHIIVCAPTTVIGSVVLCVAYGISVWMSVLVVVTVFATVVFCAYGGLLLGLLFPKFGWQNENAVIKQGMAVTLAMLGGMAFFIVMGVVGFFAAKVSPWLSVATVLAVCCIVSAIIHLYLMNNGAKKFENLKK